MAEDKKYLVQLKPPLKSWRSGGQRFVADRPMYLSEEKAKPFLLDGHFSCCELSKEALASLRKKGVVPSFKPVEKPRLSEELKQDAKDEMPASGDTKPKVAVKP